MNKTAGNVLKGAAAGAIVGTATTMAMNAGHKKGAQMKKKASKAMKTVSNVFESISEMM